MPRTCFFLIWSVIGYWGAIGEAHFHAGTAYRTVVRQLLETKSAPSRPATVPCDPHVVQDGADRLAFHSLEDRLQIGLDGESIVDFVFRDKNILRPYFSNAKLSQGRLLTRNHPPIPGTDAVDHDRMHPGIWLGFGDINGEDFWRNKATMEHNRFIGEPRLETGRLRFATESLLRAANGSAMGTVQHHLGVIPRPSGWLLVWRAVFIADQGPLTFGDQEEMGFAARVATPLTEQQGGKIRNSRGQVSAAATWGQPAAWCDYSGGESTAGGILLLSGGDNFRESWWHNRDYGVMVANPFGRAAMQQGPPSEVTIAAGESLTLAFGALLHEQAEIDFEDEWAAFEESLSWLKPN